MDLGLKEKRALVTGSSMGIGRGIAQALIAEGATVVINARNEEKLNQTFKAISASMALPADLSQEGAITGLIQKVIKASGGLDILVLNSGGPDTGNFLDIPVEKWQTNFNALWRHVLEGLQAALPDMKARQWGRILLVASIAAKEPIAGLTISNAFWAGLLGLLNSVSREVAAFGITVNVLLPGYTKTERLADLNVPEEQLSREVPAKRIGMPREMGALAAFLVSEQASYITGQAIACDGGLLKTI